MILLTAQFIAAILSLFGVSQANQDMVVNEAGTGSAYVQSTGTTQGHLDAAYLGGSGVNDRTTYVSTGSAE